MDTELISLQAIEVDELNNRPKGLKRKIPCTLQELLRGVHKRKRKHNSPFTKNGVICNKIPVQSESWNEAVVRNSFKENSAESYRAKKQPESDFNKETANYTISLKNVYKNIKCPSPLMRVSANISTCPLKHSGHKDIHRCIESTEKTDSFEDSFPESNGTPLEERKYALFSRQQYQYRSCKDIAKGHANEFQGTGNMKQSTCRSIVGFRSFCQLSINSEVHMKLLVPFYDSPILEYLDNDLHMYLDISNIQVKNSHQTNYTVINVINRPKDSLLRNLFKSFTWNALEKNADNGESKKVEEEQKCAKQDLSLMPFRYKLKSGINDINPVIVSFQGDETIKLKIITSENRAQFNMSNVWLQLEQQYSDRLPLIFNNKLDNPGAEPSGRSSMLNNGNSINPSSRKASPSSPDYGFFESDDTSQSSCTYLCTGCDPNEVPCLGGEIDTVENEYQSLFNGGGFQKQSTGDSVQSLSEDTHSEMHNFKTHKLHCQFSGNANNLQIPSAMFGDNFMLQNCEESEGKVKMKSMLKQESNTSSCLYDTRKSSDGGADCNSDAISVITAVPNTSWIKRMMEEGEVHLQQEFQENFAKSLSHEVKHMSSDARFQCCSLPSCDMLKATSNNASVIKQGSVDEKLETRDQLKGNCLSNTEPLFDVSSSSSENWPPAEPTDELFDSRLSIKDSISKLNRLYEVSSAVDVEPFQNNFRPFSLETNTRKPEDTNYSHHKHQVNNVDSTKRNVSPDRSGHKIPGHERPGLPVKDNKIHDDYEVKKSVKKQKTYSKGLNTPGNSKDRHKSCPTEKANILGCTVSSLNSIHNAEQETLPAETRKWRHNCASSETNSDQEINKCKILSTSGEETYHNQMRKQDKLNKVVTAPTKVQPITNIVGSKKSQKDQCARTVFNKCSDVFDMADGLSVLQDNKRHKLTQEKVKEHHTIKNKTERLELVCKYCDKIFDRLSKLKEHLGTHTLPYTCLKCGCCFGRESQLVNHERRNSCAFSKRRHFKCEDCGESFLQRTCLTKHVQIHIQIDKMTKVKHFRCKVCGKIFSAETQLSGHETEHTKKRSHSCELCGKAFLKSSHLARHQMTHITKQEQMECADCGETFVLKGLLRLHVRQHLMEARSSCRVRQSVKHNTVPENKHVCNSQITKTDSDSNMAKSDMKLSTSPTPYQMRNNDPRVLKRGEPSGSSISDQQNLSLLPCTVCGKLFRWKTELKRHLLTHKKEVIYNAAALDPNDSSFWCNDCGSEFKIRANLCRHVRQHIREKINRREPRVHHMGLLFKYIDSDDTDDNSAASPIGQYCCNTCGQSFSEVLELHGHHCVTVEQRPHICYICDKSFMDVRHLSRHMTVHFPPYHCKYCGHSFARRVSWRCHEDRHKHLERFKREGYYWRKSQ